MTFEPISDELLEETVEAYRSAGTVSGAARLLGIARQTVQNRIRRASERGMLGYDPVMPGFVVKQVSSRVGDHFVKQVREPGEAFATPKGHIVKGVSALVNPEGRVMAKWIKTREGEPAIEDVIDIVTRRLEAWTPSRPAIVAPNDAISEMLSVYVLCDLHLGLFAWGRETGGPDWDLSLAREVLLRTVAELVDQAPRSGRAIVLGLGDLLHADNSLNRTEKSGNPLDVDTRYAKCLETICDLLTEMIDAVAHKHGQVEAALKPGNHDPNSTAAMSQALRMYFRNSDHVEIDTSPFPFHYRRFGVNLIGGTHGDKTKPEQLPLVMANHRPEDWAKSTTRHFHTGHRHHDETKEIGGVHVYTHRAPVPQDAFHSSSGFLSGRSMKCFNYHAERGFKGHIEIEIK